MIYSLVLTPAWLFNIFVHDNGEIENTMSVNGLYSYVSSKFLNKLHAWVNGRE